jgi:hypothetical protein
VWVLWNYYYLSEYQFVHHARANSTARQAKPESSRDTVGQRQRSYIQFAKPVFLLRVCFCVVSAPCSVYVTRRVAYVNPNALFPFPVIMNN